MSVSPISSTAGLPLSLAIQGVLKGPVPISRTRYIDAARDATQQIQNVRVIDKTGTISRATRVDPTQRSDNASPTRAVPGRTAEPARTGTAYQTNADGDSVTLNSKLDDLTDEERAEVEKLKARDAEVRTHEQAHVAAAGALVRGGISYSYRTGPDGTRYAVGGHVNIDTSKGSTPEETIAKAQQIRAAALAPAEPSGADRAAAAKASKMEAEARAELRQQQAEQTEPAVTTSTGSKRIDETSAQLGFGGLDVTA
ncbi:MAG: putative metalloprotease CJM1_0395 family protein [Phycisphaerales bacterium]